MRVSLIQTILGVIIKGLLLTGLLVIGACNTTEVTSSEFVDDITPADELYNQALANMDAGDYKEAKRKLTQLDQQHPYSEFSRRSLILMTFIHYREGNYAETTATGKRYVSLYPGDKDAAYALYLTGMSYFKQIPHITRDQSVTARAYNAMNEVVEKYPDSEYAEDARKKMRITYDQLAGKEMLVGRYYQERREFLAAINRFRNVVTRYQQTRHVEEALARLTESYFALGLAGEAQNSAAVLGHNFPDSQWYKEVYALLQTGGLEPRENNRSWLSKLFTNSPKPS